MNGWKTYASAAALAVLGIIDMLNGDTLTGAQKLVGALALVGIGHKLDKASVTAAPASSGALQGTNENTGA
jgi:hypothetical protein